MSMWITSFYMAQCTHESKRGVYLREEGKKLDFQCIQEEWAPPAPSNRHGKNGRKCLADGSFFLACLPEILWFYSYIYPSIFLSLPLRLSRHERKKKQIIWIWMALIIMDVDPFFTLLRSAECEGITAVYISIFYTNLLFLIINEWNEYGIILLCTSITVPARASAKHHEVEKCCVWEANRGRDSLIMKTA